MVKRSKKEDFMHDSSSARQKQAWVALFEKEKTNTIVVYIFSPIMYTIKSVRRCLVCGNRTFENVSLVYKA